MKKHQLPPSTALLPIEMIERRIHLIRGRKVMLSTELADLYRVEPRALIQAVKRNADRFPNDFMFQLNAAEFKNLKSQSVISSWGGARRSTPYSFTEHGVAMLSSVLNSKRAVLMNISIIRAFVKMREVLASQAGLAMRIEKLEGSQQKHASVIGLLATEIDKLKQPPPISPKRRIGFQTNDD